MGLGMYMDPLAKINMKYIDTCYYMNTCRPLNKFIGYLQHV
jgi:hypothetical protein